MFKGVEFLRYAGRGSVKAREIVRSLCSVGRFGRWRKRLRCLSFCLAVFDLRSLRLCVNVNEVIRPYQSRSIPRSGALFWDGDDLAAESVDSMSVRRIGDRRLRDVACGGGMGF